MNPVNTVEISDSLKVEIYDDGDMLFVMNSPVPYFQLSKEDILHLAKQVGCKLMQPSEPAKSESKPARKLSKTQELVLSSVGIDRVSTSGIAEAIKKDRRFALKIIHKLRDQGLLAGEMDRPGGSMFWSKV